MLLKTFVNPVHIRSHQSLFKYCLLSILLLISTNLWSEERILESINVTEEQGFSVIDIKLNQQLTVSSYTPQEGGDLLRIRVKQTGSAAQITEQPDVFESLPWKATRNVPLDHVEVDLSDKSVMLYFNQSVKYKVRGGNNAFHIFVEVFHSGKGTQSQDKSVQTPVDIEIKQHVIKGAKDPVAAEIMEKARKSMLAKNYYRATQLYTQVVLDYSKSIYAKEALEYLGFARERRGQLSHAKVAYDKYLKLYPEGEDTDRVKQRLAGVLTARAEPRDKLRKGKRKPESEAGLDWTTFGSVSQYYNRDVSKLNDNSSNLNRSSLQDNLDVTTRLRTQDYQVTGRFSGSYEDNLETSDQDEHRISSFYADVENKPLNSKFRIGRQSRSTGGVLGRFDGLLVSFPAMDNVQLNLVGGYSVESSRDVRINNDTNFYGISADIGTFFNTLDFNVFFIEQNHQNILDRRAVGGEIRYFEANRSFFTFLDYDIYHEELNTFLFTGQYVFPDRTTINVTYDERKTPLLTSFNALNGQSGGHTLDDMLDFMNKREISDLAIDRTATTRSASIGFSRPLTEQLQLNADFRWSKTGGSKDVADVFTPGTIVTGAEPIGDDFTYSTDLTANSLLTSGDLYTIGFRYQDFKRNTTTFTLNARYPITRNFRINPKFKFDYRDNEDGTSGWGYQPSVRITYKVLRRLQFEVEGGGDWQFDETIDPNDIDRFKGYFVIAGYRLDF